MKKQMGKSKKDKSQHKKNINEANRKLKEQYRQLITELIEDLNQYEHCNYKLLENNYGQNHVTGLNEFLNNPYMVFWYIENTAKILGQKQDYGQYLYINEEGTALFIDDENKTEIMDPGWLFLGYSEALENKIQELNNQMQAK